MPVSPYYGGETCIADQRINQPFNNDIVRFEFKRQVSYDCLTDSYLYI